MRWVYIYCSINVPMGYRFTETEQSELTDFIRFFLFSREQARKKLQTILQEEEEDQHRSFTYPPTFMSIDRSLH